MYSADTNDIALQVTLGVPEKIETLLDPPGNSVVHVTYNQKHLLYTDIRGQVCSFLLQILL
jgi:hypothetical protein